MRTPAAALRFRTMQREICAEQGLPIPPTYGQQFAFICAVVLLAGALVDLLVGPNRLAFDLVIVGLTAGRSLAMAARNAAFGAVNALTAAMRSRS